MDADPGKVWSCPRDSKLDRSVPGRSRSSLTLCVCVCLTVLCLCAAYTYEQYQQHQEQLSLMHKQQLEQVQLQQQVGSSTATNSSHVSIGRAGAAVSSSPRPPDLVVVPRQSPAHTLDQAKAQFAASALITVDQLLALKTKEELGPGGGVNGVLSPSGTPTLSSRPPLCPSWL